MCRCGNCLGQSTSHCFCSHHFRSFDLTFAWCRHSGIYAISFSTIFGGASTSYESPNVVDQWIRDGRSSDDHFGLDCHSFSCIPTIWTGFDFRLSAHHGGRVHTWIRILVFARFFCLIYLIIWYISFLFCKQKYNFGNQSTLSTFFHSSAYQSIQYTFLDFWSI